MSITKISPSVVDFDAGITISTTDNTSNLILTSTDADANIAPLMQFYRNSSSPADNDQIGRIEIYGENDADEKILYGEIVNQIKDASDGSEDGRMAFNVMTAGTAIARMDILPEETVFNQGGYDVDFRVESDVNTHSLFVEGETGNVSIGNSSVAFPSGDGLQVYSASNPRIKLANSTTGVASGDGTQFYLDGADVIYDNKDAGNQRWYTGGAERMRVTSGGNVGIGTSSPGNSILYVAGDAASGWTYHLKNTQTSGSTWGQYIQYAGTAPDDNNSQFFHCGDTGSARFIVYGDGDAWTADAGTLSSDRTLKTNIQDATPKLADVMKLKVRNFEWDETFRPAKKGKKHIGFIAQEFEEVFPALVSEHDIAGGNPTEEDHTPIIKKALKEAKLIPILVKAMQEQQALIETLQTKVKALEEA